MVAPGVHYRGIDERRLVPFAEALAESGLAVLTPELAELGAASVQLACTRVPWRRQVLVIVIVDAVFAEVGVTVNRLRR